MFGLFKGQSEKERSNEIRRKQVESMLAYNPTAKPLDSTGNSYELVVNTKFGNLPFRIILGPRFPEEPPQVHVPTPVIHRWVDKSYNVVGHPNLQKWAPRNHLGRIVKEIYQEFYTNPPTPYIAPQSSQPTSAVTPVPTSQGSITGVGPNNSRPVPPIPQRPSSLTSEKKQRPPPPPKTQPPRLPDKFPELQALSEPELEQLLEHDDYLSDFAQSLKGSKEFLGVKAELTSALQRATEDNLAKEATLKELVEGTQAARSQVDLKLGELEELQQKQAQVAEKFSLVNILHALKEAIDEAEEEADALKQRYRDQSDDEDSDDDSSEEEDEDEDQEKPGKKKKKKKKSKKLKAIQFATKYTKLRKKVHELAGQRERLKEIYLRDGRPDTATGRGHRQPVQGAPPPLGPRPQVLLGASLRQDSLRMLI